MQKKNPYKNSASLKMLPSFVCYADILGYSQLSKKAIRSGDGIIFLKKLHNALSIAYERLRGHARGFSNEPFSQ